MKNNATYTSDSSLIDAIFWCERQLKTSYSGNIGNVLRSRELAGSSLEWQEILDETMVGSAEWRKAIYNLVEKRAELLKNTHITINDNILHNYGRLLVCQTGSSLHDGSSQFESQGYFDLVDIPPWDTWIAYESDCYIVEPLSFAEEEGYLISWVPSTFIPLVQKGIETNTSGCIRWASDINSQNLDALQAVLENGK